MENVVERSVTVAAVTPPIVITSPVCAAEASGTLEVAGESIFFEIPLHLDLRDASGAVVATQRVFADPQGVERGAEAAPWTATVDLSGLAPGFYDLVIYNRNRETSAVENEFPVQISVR
jgi:immunoglobulin-like protein involved in spore germination